jgi:hypothetical protein
MSFELDAAGRAPHEPGYVDPRRTSPSGGGAGLIVTPPDDPEDRRDESGGILSSHDPDEARSLAAGTANAIRSRSSGWRNRLMAFQRAAGINPDGAYGGLSYNALLYYGIRNPPPARTLPRPSSPAANYVDRVITAGDRVR